MASDTDNPTETKYLLKARVEAQQEVESRADKQGHREDQWPQLTWVDGVNSVPWLQFRQELTTLSLCFIVIPISVQVLWMSFFKQVHDVQYYPVGIPTCLLGAYWSLRSTVPEKETIKIDDDDPDLAEPSRTISSQRNILDANYTYQTTFALRTHAKWVVLIMSIVLYDSLFYPWGFLSHVHWHYDRCALTCHVPSTTTSNNNTWDFCTAAEHPVNQTQAWCPTYVSDDTVFAPQFFTWWVYKGPVEEVAHECKRLEDRTGRLNTTQWKTLLKDKHSFMHFFVRMTAQVHISKVEIFGPILGGCILTLIIAAAKVEEFKIHQVGWARVTLLDRIDKGHCFEEVKQMAKDMVTAPDVEEGLRIRLIAQLFGIKEAVKMFEGNKADAAMGLEVTRKDVALALAVAVLHSTLAGIWRAFINRHVFPLAGGYMWWFVMMKIAVAQGAILFLGYLVNIHTTQMYGVENVLYLLFERRWPLCQTFRVERTDTRTIQIPDLFSEGVAVPLTTMERATSPLVTMKDDIAKWLHLEELILLSTIAPRTAQALHLWILIVWFFVTSLLALSNFILEWPRTLALHPSDVVAFMDFALIGFLINKGMQSYVQVERLKKHDLDSLEKIDREWDFKQADAMAGADDESKPMRWLVKTRIHDLKEGCYAVSKSSQVFNDKNLKRAMASILAAVGTQGFRVLGNFYTSSMGD